MLDVSTFRGLSGEVVRSVIRPKTITTALPIIAFFGVLALALGFLSTVIPSVLLLIILLGANAFITGKFAMAASYGEIDCGLLSSQADWHDAFNYAVRYVVMTLFWALPVILVAWLIVGNVQTMVLGALSTGQNISMMSIGFKGIVLALLAVVMVTGPVFTSVLACYAESIQDAWSADTYLWLFESRRDDLVPLFSNIIGGIFLFWGIYSIPLLIVCAISFAISSWFGMIISAICYLLPTAVMPILIGRTAGAFMLGDTRFEVHPIESPYPTKPSSSEFTESATGEASMPSEAPLTAKQTSKLVCVYDIRQEVNDVKTEELGNYLRTTDEHYHQQKSIYYMLKLAYIFRRQGDFCQAMSKINEAIPQMITMQYGEELIEIYVDFKTERDKFKLTAIQYEAMADYILNHELYKDAVWFLCKAHEITSDSRKETIQGKIFEIANTAATHEQWKIAQDLYLFFKTSFPESKRIDEVQVALEKTNQELRRKSA